MEKIAKQLTELIGNTPLLELTNYEKENELKAKVIAKLEYFNRTCDCGSSQRIASDSYDAGYDERGET